MPVQTPLTTLASRLLPSLDHPALALIAYGSGVEGLANQSSDLDVLAITEGTRSLQLLTLDATPIHVEYIPRAELRRSLEELDWNFRTRAFDFHFLVARLRRSVILHDPEGVAEDLIADVRAYQPSADVLTKFHAQARALYQDAVGAYREGHWEHAILLGRLATQVLTAWKLLSLGELNVGLKWQHRWAERTLPHGDSWWQDYRTALGLPVESGKAREHAVRALRAAYRLIREG